ncbi:hypothetical protein J3A83DRAFT_4363134 [Scleroderma citrinum]
MFIHLQMVNLYYLFQSHAEWSLAKFLIGNFTQTQINQFLALPWFHHNPRLSFTSTEQLTGWMDSLPPEPKWQSTILEVENYPTADPIHLIWHGAVEVVASLFGDPIFGANMTFDPVQITTLLGWEYNMWFSANEAHHIQDSLPLGATIIPILAASDKTPVMRMTGGLEMHPLFISIGNIPGHICMAATSHAWQCVVFMPIPKFNTPKACQLILQAHVWHNCVNIVTMGLKCLAHIRGYMPDSHGNLQYCFTPLIIDPWDLCSFQKNVHLPCWRNWPYANLFFFFDHILTWCKEVFKVRHFRSSREHHDIQHTIISMIAGCVPLWFLCAIHTLINFIYQAQSPEMESSLHEFHAHKDAVIKTGARRTRAAGSKVDFYIPKLELFYSFVTAVCNNADISEHLLITHYFTEQVVQILDHEEVIQHNIPLINTISMEEEEIGITDPTLALLTQLLFSPCPVHNYFVDGILTNHTQTALHITSHPEEINLLLHNIAEQFHLPDFQDCYLEFLQLHSSDLQFDMVAFDCITMWYKLHIQIHSMFSTSITLPSQVVQAMHPSQDFPYGCCDAVLISPPKDASYVAQVCTIFHPHTPPCSKVKVPLYLKAPLIYLQPFHVIATPEHQPELQMWTLERCCFHTEGGQI